MSGTIWLLFVVTMVVRLFLYALTPWVKTITPFRSCSLVFRWKIVLFVSSEYIIIILNCQQSAEKKYYPMREIYFRWFNYNDSLNIRPLRFSRVIGVRTYVFHSQLPWFWHGTKWFFGDRPNLPTLHLPARSDSRLDPALGWIGCSTRSGVRLEHND